MAKKQLPKQKKVAGKQPVKYPSGRTRGLKRGGGPGRKKGVPNKVTIEAKLAAAGLVDDPVYRRKLATDLRKRKVHPAIESMLWHYAKGKPKETVALEGSVTVVTDAEINRLSDEDLVAAKGAAEVLAALVAKVKI